MEIFYFKVLLITVLSLATLPEAASSIVDSFEESEIVPDVIPVAPAQALKVVYPGGLVVNEGEELTPTNVRNTPSVEWVAEQDSYYTLSMSDPDAPSRAIPISREYLHWLVGNIPGNNVDSGVPLAGYVGSAPPLASGLHRYTILLYKQELGKIDFTEPIISNTTSEGRAQFRIARFAEKYSMGNPIAGNFFQAKNENNV